MTTDKCIKCGKADGLIQVTDHPDFHDGPYCQKCNPWNACPSHGTCYDLDDARRALADRPSMEAELAELRDEASRNWIAFVQYRADNARLREQLTDLTGKAIAVTDERDDLRREVERIHKQRIANAEADQRQLDDCIAGRNRLEAALREIDQIVKIHPDLLIPRDYNMSEIEIARTQKAILTLGDIAAAALAKMGGGGKE